MRDYKPVDSKCFEIINHYKVWITTMGKNKKPSLCICRPEDNVYENVGLLHNPELFIEMLRGSQEPIETPNAEKQQEVCNQV